MPYNRRYSSNPGLGFLTASVVNQIIVANVVVFVLQIALSRTSFIDFFGLRPSLVVSRGFVWQIFTYMFLHGGFWHLFLNMFIIWMFGTPLESVWGSKRFLIYYFICGLGGALFSFLFSFDTTVIGASGAGYGILLAYAMLFPEAEIYVWGLIPVRARTLVIFMTLIEFASGISGVDGIAHFAHLGGMAAGFVYLRSRYRGLAFWRRKPQWRMKDDGDRDRDGRWNDPGGGFN